MIKKLAKSIREYKKPSLLCLIFIVLEAILECLMPFIIADLVNKVKDGCGMPVLLQQGGILLVMALVSLTCGAFAGFLSAKASSGFAKNLRHDLFHKVQTYSFENIDKFSSASLVTRMTTDIVHVQMSYMMMIRVAIRAPLMFIFSIVMAYIMGGALSTMFIIVIPFLAVGLLLIARKAMPTFRKVFRKYDRLNESIEENVRAMRAVKGFSREEYEKEKFGEAAENIRKDFTRAERIVACNTPIFQSCMYFNMTFVLLIGSQLIIKSSGATLDVGQLSAMLTYGVQILMSLMMVSMIYVMLTMSLESARRIVEVLDEEPALTQPSDAVTEIADGSIVFDHVNFKYSKKADRNALEDINLNIPSGATVGILGGTGSGKSSLVQLIARLYDVTDGRVLVGGRDVREYDLYALRNSASMVLQKNVLFSGTIKDNLRWGNPEATEEEMVEACKLAQAHEFIETFPEGYDTFIEQGGTNVSGGQRQRLCIARALLKKPKILILDDSTSAVDTKTDAFIRQGFDRFIPETTKIIIAQRVSSVEQADIIVVMDGGRVQAVGKHEELLERCDIYREIYLQQTKGGEADA
ncbi:MAG: ABC transporter ATP-binding protein [Clostridia bacterium]|nr:ABC transporter ATP-binding protein [Clostridia bacterium]